MKIEVHPGKYIVAVSGGVDSMVLLDLLIGNTDAELIVAHFDHGIRDDSKNDRILVEQVAMRNNLTFEYQKGNLGPSASEAVARDARYRYLHSLRIKYKAKMIITAHHQDDQIETAVLNLIRGVSRLGFSSLQSRNHVFRPLLAFSKQEILDYAKAKSLVWREDSTNEDVKYLRNYIRLRIVSRMSEYDKNKLINLIGKNNLINKQMNEMVMEQIITNSSDNELSRRWFIALPYKVSCEVMAGWLRMNAVTELTKKMIERLTMESKTKFANAVIDINKDKILLIGSKTLAILQRER